MGMRNLKCKLKLFRDPNFGCDPLFVDPCISRQETDIVASSDSVNFLMCHALR